MKFKDIQKVRTKKLDLHTEFRFAIARMCLDMRIMAGLTQEALAQKMGTKQPAVARAEGGSGLPSLEWMYKLAKATKLKIEIKWIEE